jgi:hypothetical protein
VTDDPGPDWAASGWADAGWAGTTGTEPGAPGDGRDVGDSGVTGARWAAGGWAATEGGPEDGRLTADWLTDDCAMDGWFAAEGPADGWAPDDWPAATWPAATWLAALATAAACPSRAGYPVAAGS